MSFSRADRAQVTDWWLTVDRTLLALVLILAIAGALASLVATPQAAIHFRLEPFYFAKRHVIALFVALIVVVAVSLLNPHDIKRLALFLFCVGVLLMFAALLQGAERNGATRWLYFAGLVVQPSELAKPGFAVLSAWLFAESQRRPDMPALELAVVSLAVFITLLVLQPDMGQTIIVATVWCGLFFLSGYSLRIFPFFAFIALLGLVAAYFTVPHFASRIDRFAGGGSEVQQTTIAVNAFRDAGWLGRGLGEGFTKARLPDAHNDYVFAAIAEEAGIAACLFLILIYGLIVWRSLRSAFRESDAFARLAVSGLIMIFGFQALINMAVNLNLLPTKGVTLPFVSYGRSSLLSSAITLGMILSFTRRAAGVDAFLSSPSFGRLTMVAERESRW
jgi:cell division protein FtsW